MQSCGKPLQYALCAEEIGIDAVCYIIIINNQNGLLLIDFVLDPQICRTGTKWCGI